MKKLIRIAINIWLLIQRRYIYCSLQPKQTAMNFIKKGLFIIISLPFLTGCASIVSKSTWPFSVDSNPAGASVSITNKAGKEVYKGRTPVAMKLKSGAGFFSKESYTVSLSLNGYETKKVNVECKINGWYFGNIVIGGIVGMLIVDPATGAMYKLDSEGISENLSKSSATSLNILDKNKIPDNWNSHLVKIN